MEPRLLIAYGLMTVMGVSGLAWAALARRRRAARRLRLRGIKVEERR